ncbi:DUF3613 domain-containing protein [Bordetella petrii]|nr:DUF3613 domain-containing protein [Bordetella petrii]
MFRDFHLYLLVFAAALPATALAQTQAPLTGGAAAQPAAPAAVPAGQPMPERAVVRQVQTPMPAAPAPVAAGAGATQAGAAPAEHWEDMGDVTRGLLAAQADGRRAGGALPILGPVSTASWNRYLESFRQPIPQWFAEKVETDSK